MTTVAPARTPHPAVIWARQNLFHTRRDTVVTLLFGALGVYVVYRLAWFVFVTARWEIIEVNLKLLMVGNWDVIHLPRIAVALVVAATTGGLIAGLVHARQVRRGITKRGQHRQRQYDGERWGRHGATPPPGHDITHRGRGKAPHINPTPRGPKSTHFW